MVVVRLRRVYGVCVGRLRSKTEVVREGPTAKPKYNEVFEWPLWLDWRRVDCTLVIGVNVDDRGERKVSEGEYRVNEKMRI